MREVRPLIEVVRELPDPRSAQGRRHPLDAMRALTGAAMLCGRRSERALAECGRSYDPALVRALGFTRERTPCAATFDLAFRYGSPLRRLARERLGAAAAGG